MTEWLLWFVGADDGVTWRDVAAWGGGALAVLCLVMARRARRGAA